MIVRNDFHRNFQSHTIHFAGNQTTNRPNQPNLSIQHFRRSVLNRSGNTPISRAYLIDSREIDTVYTESLQACLYLSMCCNLCTCCTQYWLPMIYNAPQYLVNHGEMVCVCVCVELMLVEFGNFHRQIYSLLVSSFSI